MDAIARHLAETGVPVTQIAWGRYVANGLILFPIVLARSGRRALLPRWEPLHLVRSVIPAATAVVFFLGLRFLPFASASALLFTNPFFITAFSTIFLGERVGARRWAAVVAGFAGALLVIRPGAELFRSGALLPMAAAIGFAAVAVMNRKLAGDTPASATTLHYSIVAAVFLAPAAACGWRPFDAGLVLWLAAMAAIGGTSLWLVTAAYERAEASVLAPFHYLELAAALGIGFAIFGETPDLPAFAGIALILSAGLAVSYRRSRAVPRSTSEEAPAGEA
jgi:drug/metabolite transporter (DMT)-like permease